MQTPEALNPAAEMPSACLLCGRPALILGCFVPHEPQRWSSTVLAPGMTLVFFYGLCSSCFQKPDLTDQVETSICRDLLGRLN